MHAGNIRGELILKFPGEESLNLGKVAIPLTARVLPRIDSESPEIAVELKANLEEVRDTVETIFRTT